MNDGVFLIDDPIRFDDAAAHAAVATLRAAAADAEQLLHRRGAGVLDLERCWEGKAKEWFAQRNAGWQLIAAAAVEQLLLLAGSIDAMAATAAHDRAIQAAAQAAAEAERLEAARRAAELAAQGDAVGVGSAASDAGVVG